MFAAILAHQGGWDEMLMVAGPIGLFAYILRRANQRAEAAAAAAVAAGTALATGANDDEDDDLAVEGSVVDAGDVGTE